VTTTTQFSRKKLRAGSALQALALLGAGLTISAGLAAPAAAQDFTNINATGRVQGTDGQPIDGATVAIHSESTGIDRTVTTSNGGSFNIPQIPPGTYTFTVSADGYNTYSESGIALTRAAAGNQFTLAPAAGNAAASGDIVVTAGRIQVADFDQTTTGAIIPIGELATRVPVQRSLRDVILLAPGTVQGGSAQNANFAGQATIGGSSFAENAYYINGLNITEFRQGFSPVSIPFDFYDTVEVKTGGFSAEFGRATGGVVNATTKSGSNDFHGSVLVNFEPDALTSDDPNTYAADNDGDYHQRTDTVFQLSGPVIKDHLFFYGIANFRDVKDRNGGATSGIATVQRTTSPFFGGKLDAFWWGQHLEFTYFDTSNETRNRSFNYDPDTNELGLARGGSRSLGGGENYVGRYTGTLTDWLTISAAYGVNKNRSSTLPLDTVTPRIQDIRTGDVIELGNTSTSTTTDDDKREFYRGDVDLNFNLLGSHHVRFGYDHELLTSNHVSQRIGLGNYTILTASDPNDLGIAPGTDYVTVRHFTNGGTFTTVNEAYYIEDSWSLLNDRLTLNLGIRNDRFDNRGAGGDTFYASGDQWGPRLGFTLDPTGSGRIKVFGSFGRYFLPIAGNTNIRGAGSETDFTRYHVFGGIGADGIPILGAPIIAPVTGEPCPDTGVNNCQVVSNGEVADPSAFQAQGLKPQSLDEYIIGYEQRFGQHWKVGAAFTWRKLNRALEDAAIDQAAIAYCIDQGFSAADCGDIYTGFAQYVLVNPGEDATITLSGAGGIGLPDGTNPVVNFTAEQLGYPKAKRDYKALTFTVDREFDGVWSFSGSYTIAADIGNYEGGVKSDIGQSDSGATEDFDQPGFTYGIYGYLPNHRRHTIKLYGSYQLTDWLMLGANAVIQSPKKFGCLGVVPLYVDPFAAAYGGGSFFCADPSNPTVSTLIPRGTAFQSDWRKELDLTAQFRLPVDFDASLRFDVFNVLNDKSALDFNEIGDIEYQVPDPHYGDPLVYQAARSARIQLRVGF
jgi:hypothetical protein